MKFRFRDLNLAVISEIRVRAPGGIPPVGNCGGCTNTCTGACSGETSHPPCRHTGTDYEFGQEVVYPGELELIRTKLQEAIALVDQRIEKMVVTTRDRKIVGEAVGLALEQVRNPVVTRKE